MSIFLTRKIGEKVAGKDIKAKSWKKAEEKCPKGYKIDGELVAKVKGETPAEVMRNVRKLKNVL